MSHLESKGTSSQSIVIVLDSPLVQTYFVHAAVLVLKLLALSPMTAVMWIKPDIIPNSDFIRRAYLIELKRLAPFWITGALYVSTNPPMKIALSLIRLYTISRYLDILEYFANQGTVFLTDLALITSYMINCYMCIYVIYFYRNAL